MNASEFITELRGSHMLEAPEDVAARLPKSGRVRVIVLPDDDAEDAIYDSQK